MARKLIELENTRFIFGKNLSGDPSKDRFKDNRRKVSIVIPTEALALELIDEGFNVRQTKPREDEEEGFVPDYFITAIANYDSKWPPKIYLIPDDKSDPVLLTEENVGIIDDMFVKNVNVVLNTWERPDGISTFIKTMYVEQDLDGDPFAARYRGRRNAVNDQDEEAPWN